MVRFVIELNLLRSVFIGPVSAPRAGFAGCQRHGDAFHQRLKTQIRDIDPSGLAPNPCNSAQISLAGCDMCGFVLHG
jgi:hypothetical protein